MKDLTNIIMGSDFEIILEHELTEDAEDRLLQIYEFLLEELINEEK